MRPRAGRISPIWPLIVALAGVLPYLNAMSNGFTLDDIPLVRDNPEIVSPQGIPRIFLLPYWTEGGAAAGLYRPATIASLAVNRAITGPEPLGFHLVNVLLHALVCALTWIVARRTSVLYGTALLTGLLFAVHPVHVEAVANVAGRAELLSAVGVLAAWLCHRRAGEGKGWGSRVCASVAYLFALLSKESAVLAPFLFLLDDALRRGETGGSRVGRLARAYGGYFLAASIGGVLRAHAIGGFRGATDAIFLDNPAAFAGGGPRILTAVSVLARYARLLVWPSRLSSDYSFDAVPVVRSAADPWFLLGVFLVAALAALFAHGVRRAPPLALGVAILGLFLLPTANLLFATGTMMAERLLYLPALGTCLLAGHVAAWVGSREARPPWRSVRRWGLVTVCSVALFALAARTWVRNPAWRDNASLALRDVRTFPRSAKLQAGAGIVLHKRGDNRGAEDHYRLALAIYPDYAQVHFNLGMLLLPERGADPGEAIEHLERAAALSPGNPRPEKELAQALEREGRLPEALAAYAKGTALDPSDFGLRLNYGRALLVAGRKDEARAVLQQLASEDSAGLPGRLAWAMVEVLAGRPAEAVAIYRELLRRPGLPDEMRRGIDRSLAELMRSRGE